MSTFDVRKSAEEAMLFAHVARAALQQTVPTMGGEAQVMVWVAGSLRRAHDVNGYVQPGGPYVGDVDLLVTTDAPNALRGFKDMVVPEWMTATEKKAHGWLNAERVADAHVTGRMMIDAWWSPWESIGPFAMFLTGPMELNVWMRQQANAVNLMLTQYGLFTPVPKPTKTNPDRRVTGARRDVVLGGRQSLLDAEVQFWGEFARLTGTDMPFPLPQDREKVMGRASRNPTGLPTGA